MVTLGIEIVECQLLQPELVLHSLLENPRAAALILASISAPVSPTRKAHLSTQVGSIF